MLPRRAYLRATAFAGGLAVAGCIGDEDDGAPEDDGADGAGGEDDSDGGDGDGTDSDGGGDDGGDDADDGDDLYGDGDGAYGGDDGGGTGDGSDDETATPTGEGGDGASTPAESDGQSEYPDYDWEILEGESPAETTSVTLTEFAYDPVVASVPAGEEITFDNQDSAPHTVTAPALDVDRELDSGESASITVEEPGTYDYVCRFHSPSMLGRLVVE